MSYKLEKPYTEQQKADFIVTYNHIMNLTIEENDEALYAIEPYELWVDGEVVDNSEQYQKEHFEQLKIQKREEINHYRDEAEQGGFEYMGKMFDSDQVSCQRISCAAQAMQLAMMTEDVPTITWTCQDNTTIELNAQQLLGLVVALAEWSNSCHQKATELKSRIDLATTEDELNQIVWEN